MSAARVLPVSVRPILDELIEEYGGDRQDWGRVFDCAARPDDEAVLRALENQARQLREPVVDISIARRGKMRGALARRLGGGRTLAQMFRGLFVDGGSASTRDSWFDASYYAVDGGSGKTSDFVDYINGTHTLHQGTSGLQVAVPTADATFGNAKTATFVRASATRYQSSRTATTWKYLHDGTGCTTYAVYCPTVNSVDLCLWTTRIPGGANGSTHYRRATDALGFAIGSSVDSNGSGGLTINVPTYVGTQYIENDSPEWSVRTKSVQKASGSCTPSASDPSFSLLVGSHDTSGTSSLEGRVRSYYFFRRTLPAASKIVAQTFIQLDTGVAP